MQNGKCTEYFPNKFINVNTIDSYGYSIFKVRDDGKFIKNCESFIDNRFVVPCNRIFFLKYNACGDFFIYIFFF